MNRIEERAAYTKRTEDYIELIKRFTDPDLREVGNYAFIKEIGSGAFGKVYMGYHKFLRSRVCLKRGERAPDHSDNMMREYYYLREFGDHPYIAKLYELLFTEMSVFLVMEYYPEGDLFEYLSQRGGKIPLEETLKLFVQLASAVFYIHRNGCCHRDLKLENVLLDRHYNVKLSDFGFTREMPLGSQGGNRGSLTEFCGTLAYMAPELVRKEAYSGVKTDIWALGVILYTMLSGQMPFDDSLTDEELMDAILKDEPDYRGFSSEVTVLLKKMLAKLPENRPNTLEDVMRLPLFEAYGGEQQVQKVDKMMDCTGSRHTEFTSSGRALLKELGHIGFDKESLKSSVVHNKMDQLDGFWNLLLDKKQRKAERRKKRSRSMLRLSSFDTSRVRAWMTDTETKEATGDDEVLAVPAPAASASAAAAAAAASAGMSTPKQSIDQQVQSSQSSQVAQSIGSTRHESRATQEGTSSSAPTPAPASAPATTATTATVTSAAQQARTVPSGQSLQSQKSQQSSVQTRCRPKFSLLDLLRPKRSKLYMNSTESTSKDSLLKKIFSRDDNNANSSASIRSSHLNKPLQKNVRTSVVVIEPDRRPSQNQADGKQQSVHRPPSMISSYSVQTTISENSNTSGNVTAGGSPAPPQRPSLNRGISDWSIGTESSFTGLSRNNSVDSSTPAPAARRQQLNTKWSFGVASNNSLKRYRNTVPKQIIEEESEDILEENDEYADGESDEVASDNTKDRLSVAPDLDNLHISERNSERTSELTSDLSMARGPSDDPSISNT